MKNADLFDNVEALLSSLKGRLIRHTEMTGIEKNIEIDDRRTDENLALERNEIVKSKSKELQGLLIANLPVSKYGKAKSIVNEASDIVLESSYKTKKEINEMVKSFEFESLEDSADECSDTDDIVDIPKKCNGAFIPFGECVNVLLKKIEVVLALIPGATMQDLLKDACIITCPDGAVHDSLPKKKSK